MSQLLEASMLICFGISWPMNVYKNVKSKTAKSMSLQFIILIIAGYLAGIVAKILTHTVNYVLAVYVLNLVIVSANLLVYFRNKKYDLKKEKEENIMISETKNGNQESERNAAFFAQMERYKTNNKSANPRGVVFFGSDSFKNINFNELMQNSNLDERIYNRSFADIRIETAVKTAGDVIDSLVPSKIFLNFGENDIKDSAFNINSFVESYRWLLYTLHQLSDAKLYIVPVFGSSALAAEVNTRLKKLSVETGCVFINLDFQKEQYIFDSEIFNDLKSYIRSHPITFAEAVQ